MEEGESIVYGSRTPVMGIEYDWSSRSWTGEAVRSKGDSEQQSASLEFNSPTLAIRDPRARSQNRRLIYDFPLPEETGAWIPVSVPPNRLAAVGSVSQGRNAFAEDGGWFTDRAEYDEARESLPEVNLWNVLNGFIQIIAGRNVPQMSNEDMSTQTWPELSHRYSSRSGLVSCFHLMFFCFQKLHLWVPKLGLHPIIHSDTIGFQACWLGVESLKRLFKFPRHLQYVQLFSTCHVCAHSRVTHMNFCWLV